MSQRLLALILFVASLGIFIFWVQPQWRDIGALQKQRESFETTLARFREFRKIRDDLLSKYNAISKEDAARLRRMLPATTEGGSIIVQLENMSRQHGLLLKRVNVAEKKPQTGTVIQVGTKPYEVVPIDFSVSGPYESFRAFLEELETSLRLIDVSAVSFVAGQENSYEFTLQAQAYWLKQK